MRTLFLIQCLMISTVTLAQLNFKYEPSGEYPYGLPHPEAPSQIMDFAPLIGECECRSEARNKDGSWALPQKMIWRFKYIMNGMAIQDETLKEDGSHSGSIRQFNKDSLRWYVHYYASSSATPVLSAWEGNKKTDSTITLYRAQKAPNGTDGFYKINFTQISDKGFHWLGEWVNTQETFSYPTWKIQCTKKNDKDRSADRERIAINTKDFSKSYISGDYQAMADAYTEDGKIFPGNAPIIEGRKDIMERWVLPEGVSVKHHEVTSEELTFFGDLAYDYGYYKGVTLGSDGVESAWKGKYVIIWKKEGDNWYMHLDIWNAVRE